VVCTYDIGGMIRRGTVGETTGVFTWNDKVYILADDARSAGSEREN